jgi:hypothetical protein
MAEATASMAAAVVKSVLMDTLSASASGWIAVAMGEACRNLPYFGGRPCFGSKLALGAFALNFPQRPPAQIGRAEGRIAP